MPQRATKQERLFSVAKVNTLFISTIMLGFCLAASSVGSDNQAYAQSDEYERSLNEITAQIKAISRNLNANKKLIKTEQDKVSELEQKITELRSSKQKMESGIQQAKQEVKALQQETEALLSQQQNDLTALTQLIRERYKQGQPNYLQLLLNQKNPYAVGRLNHYFGYFTEAQQVKLTKIQANLSKVKELQKQKEKTASGLISQQQRLVTQEAALNKAVTQRNATIAKLDQKVTDSGAELKKLEADRSRLNSLIDQLAKQAARMKALEAKRAAERAAQSEAERETQSEANTRSKRPEPPRPLVAGGFKKQQGRLSPPVNAELQHRFGARLPESGMRAQGNFYATEKGQQVTAIFSGNVLFAEYLKGYGLLIIIDHGDDHISLYGHNEILYKSVGDTVKSGEVISTSGVSGGLRKPGLYFEIRRNATPVDPADWLSRG